MVEEVENNVNEEDVDNSEVAKLYRRLFDSFQEYLKNGGHAYVLDDSGYFDQFGFDAGDRKHAEELNSYANRKAIESVKKAGQQKTPEVTFAEDTLLRIRHFEKWDNQRLRDRGVYNQEKDAWKIYSWDNEEQRAKDAEIERQKREAEWQKRTEAERQKKEAEEAEKQRIEAERQKIEKENKEKTKSNNNAVEENSGGQNMNTEERKTEPKTEETVKKEVEVKDFDFEKFLAQLGQENPDMSIIKEGVEKFGTGKLPDALKERFLKELFPHQENDYLSDSRKNMHKNSKCGKLGFEDVTGIKNVLSALKDLQTDGVLDQEQITKVMTAKYPKSNGKNMAMTLALNLRAAEFKWDKFTKPEDRLVMKHNLQSYSETLEIMGQINAKALQRALKEPYKPEKINRSLTVEELSAKSEVLKEFMKDPAAYDAHLYVDGVKENETEISGNEGLLVDGKPNEGLTVNNAKKEEDEEKKEGTMDPQAGEDRPKREPFKFEKIKDQDIIQYMYENWLLEIMTRVINAPFWVADKMLDALDSKYDTNIPTSPAKGTLPKNVDAIKFLNDAGNNAAENCKKSLQNQAGYYSALLKTLKNNYGNTDFKNWKVEDFAKIPVFNVSDENDLIKMQEYHKLLAGLGLSKEQIAQKLGATEKQIEANLSGFKGNLKFAGILASGTYLANNINGPFDAGAENKVRNYMIAYMTKLYDTSQHIAQRVEKEYRLKNGLEEAKLSAQDAKKIYEESGKLYNEYVEAVYKNSKKLRDNLNNYYNAKNEDNQKVTKQGIEATKASLDGMFSDKYIDEFLNEKAPNTKDVKLDKDKKEIPLLEFTRTEIDDEARYNVVKRAVVGNRELHESMMAENAERKEKFKKGVEKIKGKGRKVVRSGVDMFRKSGKEK